MSRRFLTACATTLALAAAIHTDWHLARPTHHRLSLGLSWHWLLAAPVFALVAFYVWRTWREQLGRASLLIVGSAVLLGGILEPAYEYFVGGSPFDWAFGPERTTAAIEFVATGTIAYLIALWLLHKVHGHDLRTRHLYMVLCALGLLVPNSLFLPWFMEHGLDPQRFINDLFANGVSAFFGTDVILAAVVVGVFVMIEGARIGLRERWIPIVATCLVGVSLGLPLFLYQRQRLIDRSTV